MTEPTAVTDLNREKPSREEPDVDSILELAAIIRKVDGNNRLGAAALAEAILSDPDFPPGAVSLC